MRTTLLLLCFLVSCAHQEPKVMDGLKAVKRSFYEVQGGHHLLQKTSQATLAIWLRPTKKTAENQDIMNFSVGGDVKEQWKSRAGLTMLPEGQLSGVARAEDHEERSWNVIATPVKLNEWQHVALTIDYKNKKMEIFVNGVLVPSKAEIIFTQESTSDTPSHRVTLGSEDDGDHAFFHGDLTGFVVERRILSAEEIKNLVRHGL